MATKSIRAIEQFDDDRYVVPTDTDNEWAVGSEVKVNTGGRGFTAVIEEISVDGTTATVRKK